MIKLRRDFSNASKQKLLWMVADVEKEKISSFTDWIGDSYYTVQSWLGKLNIKNYLSNIDSYHKKVIDKNNASKKTIEDIFKKVSQVDAFYRFRLLIIKGRLENYDRLLVQMESIVNPRNRNFTTAYIDQTVNVSGVSIQAPVSTTMQTSGVSSTLVGKIITAIFTSGVQSLPWNDAAKSVLKKDEKILKNASTVFNVIGKKSKDKDATLLSSIMSYFSSLCGVATKDTTETTDAVSNFLSLFKASGKMELGLYKYYESKLPPITLAKLDKKFGKAMSGISWLTKAISTIDEGLDTYKVFKNIESNVYDKTAQVLEMSGSVFDLGVNSYTVALSSKKYLRYVYSISGSKKAVNQILVDSRALKYTTSAEVAKKIGKASTIMAIGDVAVSTIASGVKRYGQVSEDGSVDMGDVGSVGVHGALSGLNKVTSIATVGIVHFDSEQVASGMEKAASDYAKSDNWSAKLIRDQLQKGHWYNEAAAFGISVGAGAVIVGKKTVEGVGNCAQTIGKKAKAVGSWVSNGWNYIANNVIN